MTLWAVEGGAGVGKTTRLMEQLAEGVRERPLAREQRILALTFMHGSRRRLQDRLRELQAEVPFAFECATLDSFAYRLLRRWSSLAMSIGIPAIADDDHDGQCAAVARLLEKPNIREWVFARYPILVVDEAQDLSPDRLRIVQNLAVLATTLVAADEFQCLKQALRPSPAVAWINDACVPEMLTLPRRTTIPALLGAAAALRAGSAVREGRDFRVIPGPGIPLASAIVATAIRWNPARSLAVITPSRTAYAKSVVEYVTTKPCGKKKLGPYPIRREDSDDELLPPVLASLDLRAANTHRRLLDTLGALNENWVARETAAWVRRQHRILGRETFSREEIERTIPRLVRLKTRHTGGARTGRSAMTVQQAKNREFDGVIVLWPFQVGGDDEQKRRLLYNAVTRARRWCTVIVQNALILEGPPFS